VIGVYDVPRGTCPACGSGEVIHLVIGMPSDADVLRGLPEWVQLVGCVHPGWERECAACGARWSVRRGEAELLPRS
jgi:hypothetical protein